MSATSKHTWTFFRAGGLDQVQITTAADLLHLHELDQKLWVALSCPVKGLEFDSKTLELIDNEKDGRVRVPELLAAVKWACTAQKDPAQLLKSVDELPLAAIQEALAYYAENRDLIEMEANEEKRRIGERGYALEPKDLSR